MRIHHVGIATRDIDRLVDLYGVLLDLAVVHEEEIDGLRVTFLEHGDGFLELLEPTGEETIADYLDEHGPGVHHLAFETTSVENALDRARALGVELVDEEPRPGAWGHEVAFLHPKSTGGVLIEFVEH